MKREAIKNKKMVFLIIAVFMISLLIYLYSLIMKTPNITTHEKSDGVDFGILNDSIRLIFPKEKDLLKKISTGNTVLIVYTDVPGKGCRECLGLELCDWVDFSISNNNRDSINILCIVSRCKNEKRLMQEISAMKINPVILFNKNLLINDWTPRVYLLKNGQVFRSYLGDMSDRNKTENYIKEYSSFLSSKMLE